MATTRRVCATFAFGPSVPPIRILTMRFFASTRFLPRFSVAVLLVGGLLRVAVWLQNRTLFMDEANLARNLCELGLPDFFGPLKYDQFAPPLFLVLEKLAVLAVGCSELAMRFFPMLASLAALPLFWALVRRFVPEVWVAWWPVFVFAFSTFFLRYGTELKQYSTDTTLALALVWAALRVSPDTPRRAAIWATLGGTSIWFSMPSVFVLAGVGSYFLVQNFAKNTPGFWPRAAAIGAVWMASFAAYFLLILGKSVANPMLQSHHAAHFLPLLPTSAADWLRWKNLLALFPYHTAGFTVVALAFGTFAWLAGLFWAARRREAGFLLLFVPVFSCLLASGFGHYSLMPRLLMWAFPLTMILMAVGVAAIWAKPAVWLRAVLLLGMVLSASLHDGYRFFGAELADEGLKDVLAEMQTRAQTDDLTVVDESAKPVFVFYRDKTSTAAARLPGRILLANWDFKIEAQSFLQNEPPPRRVWLVFAQIISDEQRRNVGAKLEAMRVLGRQAAAIERQGAAAYLFECDWAD